MPAADLIVTNANLITLEDASSHADAMAVGDGKILYLGPAAGAQAHATPQTRWIDLAGRTVVPGFIDSHLHLLWYGRQLLRETDLVGCADIDELLSRLAELARRTEGWIIGFGFDPSKMRQGRFPTRAELDTLSATRPILVSRVCGHAAVANSAALALLSPSERRNGDESTGLYTEQHISPFYARIPPLSESEMEACILAAANVALRTGITSVQTMLDTADQMIGYSSLARKGRLPIRVIANPPWSAVDALYAHGLRTGFGDHRLRFGAAKLFSDGSLGAQTAWLSAPYADKPQTRGLRIYEPPELNRRARIAHQKGFQLAIHAIGDQAVRETLDAIEFALDGADNRLHRHRIEHASVCPPDCIERLAARRIVVTLQPQFVTSDTWTDQRLGPERARWAYPFKSLFEAGVPVALSSDCPVERLDAFACLASAVGGHPWRPGQTLTFDQALRAYCLGSAYAGFAEDRVGSLRPGKCADFVILSADPRTLPPDQLRRLRAERVFVSGIESASPPAAEGRAECSL